MLSLRKLLHLTDINSYFTYNYVYVVWLRPVDKLSTSPPQGGFFRVWLESTHDETLWKGFQLMSTLVHDTLLEDLYEEVVAELKDCGDFPMYTQQEIDQLVDQRIRDL